MKQVFFLLILILWSILQARRKAMREQKRKTKLTTPEPLGAVSEQENNDPPFPQRVAQFNRETQNISEEADRFVHEVSTQMPENVRELRAASRRAKKKASADQYAIPSVTQNDEVVERLVVSPVVEDAYTQVAAVRRSISFDKQSMRTFFVTREVLGPPRSRRPFRPGLRGRE